MRSNILILVCLVLLMVLAGCVSGNGVEPEAVSTATNQESSSIPACTTWPSDLSFDIFPLDSLDLRIQAGGLRPDDRPILHISAAGDGSDDLIELQPEISGEGTFQEIVTLPAYDYMRWNIRLLLPNSVACRYIIYGGDEWLETGVDTPESANDEAIMQDVEMMAANLGISVEEALRRLEYEDAITELQARLQAGEEDSFAGLWIEHEPVYRVVAAFTGDAQQILEPYVSENHPLASVIKARAVTYSYAQLLADQETANSLLQIHGFSFASSINVQENQVEINVTDQEAFDSVLAETGSELPPSVAVISTYEPLDDPPPFPVTPVPELHMAQLKQRDVAFMEALLIGELVIEDNCLRIHSENESYLIIWQADYYLTDNDGRIQILDETGAVVAQVGEAVYMGGGAQRALNDAELQMPVPESCGGPYWRMGEFLPEELIPNVTNDLPSSSPAADEWLIHTISDMNISFAYPPGWNIYESMKALQITPNSRPIWSSIADPDQPDDGPYLDLLYNLNRQMADTPSAEVENIIQGYDEKLEAIEPAAPLASRPDAAIGTYRFANFDDGSILLVGAVAHPLPDSPQPVIGLVSWVKEAELATIKPIFEAVLGSITSS